MARERLDVMVTQRGYAESREQAQRLIMAGKVRVDGQIATKSGHRLDESASIEVEAPVRFVGRGGDKLEAAFEAFDLDVNGMICLDIGSSTGGFTDCLLQHGAARVYAVDVGKGLLHWKLRNNERVAVREDTNARYLSRSDVPEPVQFAAIDVSFISLTKILPAVTEIFADGARLVSLIKPQFEAGRNQVGKGGVVKDPEVHRRVIEKIRTFGQTESGLIWQGMVECPVKGPAGNAEFFAYWSKRRVPAMNGGGSKR